MAFAQNFGFAALLFFLTLYLQNILGYSPLQAGFVFLAFSAVLAIVDSLAGRHGTVHGGVLAIASGHAYEWPYHRGRGAPGRSFVRCVPACTGPVAVWLQYVGGRPPLLGMSSRPGAIDDVTLPTMLLAHPVRKYGPKTVLPHDAKSLTGHQDRSRGRQKEKIQ